jgi:hypothetical protein
MVEHITHMVAAIQYILQSYSESSNRDCAKGDASWHANTVFEL